MLNDIYRSVKSHKRGRGGAATAVELSIISQLKLILPCGTLIEHEKYYPESDILHKTDIVINQEVFIHVQKDLWSGTSQQDRLKVAFTKKDRRNILYLVFDPYIYEILNTNPDLSKTKGRVYSTIQELYLNKTLHTETSFYEHILSIY